MIINHVTLFQGQIHTKKHTSKSDLNRSRGGTAYFRGSMYSTDIPDVLDDTQLKKGALPRELE